MSNTIAIQDAKAPQPERELTFDERQTSWVISKIWVE